MYLEEEILLTFVQNAKATRSDHYTWELLKAMLWNRFQTEYFKVCEEGQLDNAQFSCFSAHARNFSHSRSDTMSDLATKLRT